MFSCISGHELKKSPTLSLPNQGQTWAQYFLKMGSICERWVIRDEAWWSYIATPTHVGVNWFCHPICRILGDDIINSLTVPSAPSNLPAVPVLSSICDCVRRRMSNLAATCTNISMIYFPVSKLFQTPGKCGLPAPWLLAKCCRPS